MRLELRAELRASRIVLLGPVPWRTTGSDAAAAAATDTRIASLHVGGGVRLAVKASGAWSADATLSSLTVDDDVTPGTAFRRVLGPPQDAQAERRNTDVGPRGVSPAAPTFMSLAVEGGLIFHRVTLTSSPVVIVAAPGFIRALAAFAAASPVVAALAIRLGERMAALQSSAPADLYALLAARAPIDVRLDIAAPTLVFPDDMRDDAGGRGVVRLGRLAVRSLRPGAVLPITLGSRCEWPPRFAPSLLDGSAADAQPSALSTGPLPPAVAASQRVTLTEHSFDSWEFIVADVAVEVEGPRPRADVAVSQARVAVIEPVSLTLLLQASFLGAQQLRQLSPTLGTGNEGAPEALRLRARLSRVAVASSLALAQRLVFQQRALLGLLEGMAADAQQLFPLEDECGGEMGDGHHAWSPRSVSAAPLSARRQLPPAAPASILVDLSVDELVVCIRDVGRIDAALSRGATGGAYDPCFDAVRAVLELPATQAGIDDGDFTASVSGLGIEADVSRVLLRVTASIRSVSVVDRLQRMGPAYARFIESDPAPSLLEQAPLQPSPLLSLKARLAPVEHGAPDAASSATGPSLAAELDARSIEVRIGRIRLPHPRASGFLVLGRRSVTILELLQRCKFTLAFYLRVSDGVGLISSALRENPSHLPRAPMLCP